VKYPKFHQRCFKRKRERVAHFRVKSNELITPIGVRNNLECPILTFTSSLNSSKPEHSTIICHGLERFVAFRLTSRYGFSSGVTKPFKILKYVFTTDLNAVWIGVSYSCCSNSVVTYVKWRMEVKWRSLTFFLPILHVIS